MQVIWQRMWILVVATLLVTGMTYYLSVTTTPVYGASTTQEITLGLDPSRDQYSSLVSSEMVAVTCVEQIRSPVIVQQAIDELGLNMSAATLARAVSAKQVRSTQLIQIDVEDSNPGLARELANKVAEVFIRHVQSKQQARYESGLAELNQQSTEVEADIEGTQRLSPLWETRTTRPTCACRNWRAWNLPVCKAG